MKHRRFRIDPEKIQGPEATIDEASEIRHIRKVLRLKVGEPVVLFDGKGKEYQASIVRISPREIRFALTPEHDSSGKESPLRIILGAALLKPAKFEWLLQKATELGVTQIVPFYSSRVVSRREEGRGENRIVRWEKIVAEAAKQCGRAIIPAIFPPRSFEEVLQGDWGMVTKVILWERETTGALAGAVKGASGILVLVGPEGGFSDGEAGRAQAAGFRPVHLGPRVLRAETAGIAAVAILQYLLGDLGK